MTADIKVSRLKGNITAPPSKSILHRHLICAALADGTSVIENIAESEDILATIDCIKALGAKVRTEKDKLIIEGNDAEFTVCSTFDCRESGSTLRFFVPLAGAVSKQATFTGSERLMERGIGIYEEIFSKNGMRIEKSDGKIGLSGELKATDYTVPGNISSQYVSGLLFALPLLSGDSTVRVTEPFNSRPYVDITIAVLAEAGIIIEEREKNFFFIKGGQHYRAIKAVTEGDWSNAAFLYALRGLGNDISISGLSKESLQGDRVCLNHFERLDEGKAVIDISDCIDLGPILFAYAAAKNGGTFTGTGRLKIKESDRAYAMAEELKKFGVKTEIFEDSVTVYGGLKRPKDTLNGHNDHRIVMALTVLLTETGGCIDGIEAVKKSYPEFFGELGRLGLDVEIR